MKIIENNFEKAVAGIDEKWFLTPSLNWYNYIISLPNNLKMTYCIVIFDNQVFNGGFHQYFANGYGQFASYTILALDKIGANKKSEILKNAFRLVNPENYDDMEFSLKLLKSEIPILFDQDVLFDPLEELNEEYENVIEEEISNLLENFLKR